MAKVKEKIHFFVFKFAFSVERSYQVKKFFNNVKKLLKKMLNYEIIIS